AELLPELAGLDFDAFLASLRPADSLHARHTVGLLDPITPADQPAGSRLDDGLPETLEEVVAGYGHTYFKLKVAGDVAADVARPAARPVVIDESDADLEAFVEARARGYRGVSSKACKGLYKSLINAGRCALWNRAVGRPPFFMTAEDLTTQPGLAVQQDLALV